MERKLVKNAREAVWGARSTQIRQNKRLRRPAIAAYRGIARTVLVARPPKVFANSIPKAGTHLLTSLLGQVPALWFSGVHMIDKDYRADLHEPMDGLGDLDLAAFARGMGKIRNGQYLTAHCGALPGIPDTLHEQGFRPLLMIRDPRDIVVSMAFYFARNQRLHMHETFRDMDEGARFEAIITGLPGRGGNPPVPSIEQRLGKYQDWLTDERTVVVRFEELVGSAGGGSDEAQHAAVKNVLQHCNRYQDEAQVDSVARATFAPHSATFRKGRIGDWSNHLTQQHLDLLEEVAPGQVRAFGYDV